MKNLLLFIFAFTLLKANATVHTVNNALNGGAQFTTIQAAVDAAASGDSIYVHGSPDIYEAFTIQNKKLALFGPGWSPNKNNPARAIISSGLIRNTAASFGVNTSSGSEIVGLVFNGTLETSQSSGANLPVNNIRIERCQFKNSLNVGTSASNYSIENCIFDGSVAFIAVNQSFSYSNFLIQNNVFQTNGFPNGHFFGFRNVSNIIINHNLFYTNVPGAKGSKVFNGISNALTITNNIFVNMLLSEGASSTAKLSTFKNNLVFNPGTAPQTAPWTINDNIDGGGNQINVNPLMAAQAAVNLGTNNPLLDFSISSGPANNAGTDGKDLGLLFDATGSLNWASARGARLPFIFSMNITNPTVGPGTNLNVEVTAKSNN